MTPQAPPSFDLTQVEIAEIEAGANTERDPLDARLLLSAERVVLGTLIATNGTAALPLALTHLVKNSPDSFSDYRHKQISSIVRTLKDSGAAVYADAVIQRCEFDDADQYICTLIAGALSLDLANREAETIWQAYRERRTSLLLTEAFEAVANNPTLARSISSTVRSALNKLDDDYIKDGLPEIIDVASLAGSPPVLPRVLIEGLLHQGCKMSLGGSSKAFKSWTLINIGLSLACGRDWLGMKTTRCRVLYVNFEIPPGFLHYRIEALSMARLCFPDPGWFDVWNLRGHSAPHSIIIPKIIKRAKEAGYGLIIIDPSYKLFGPTADENSAVDVAAVMGSFENIAVQTGAAVAYGAHFAKGNAAAKEALDRVSGSGVFARDPDTILTFTKHEEKDCFTIESILRNMPPINPFVVRWDYPQFIRDDTLDPEKLKSAGGRTKKYQPDDLLAILLPSPLTSSEWEKLASTTLKMPGSTFDRLKRDLYQNNKILKSKINGKWTAFLSKSTP